METFAHSRLVAVNIRTSCYFYTSYLPVSGYTLAKVQSIYCDRASCYNEMWVSYAFKFNDDGTVISTVTVDGDVYG